MLPQLLLSKRLTYEADNYARRADPVSSGIAISMLQDAVELYVWVVLKEKNLPVKDQATFTANLDSLDKAGLAMPQVAKLLELNKARVNFKHYGNLPAHGEAAKFQQYVVDCLSAACTNHFAINFEELSLVDLVGYPEVRERLKAAEVHLASSDFKLAAEEISVAKALLFSKLDRYMPKIDWRLKDMDRVLNSIEGVSGVNPFAYLVEYIEGLRQLVMITIARVPLNTFNLLRESLPTATQFQAGNWRTNHTFRKEYNEENCRKAISAIVDISIRIQEVAA